MALRDDYLSKQDAAEQLGVSERTLNRWWSERIGPPRIKLGRAVYYRKDSLRDWINRNEEQPVREPQSARTTDTGRTRRAAA